MNRVSDVPLKYPRTVTMKRKAGGQGWNSLKIPMPDQTIAIKTVLVGPLRKTQHQSSLN